MKFGSHGQVIYNENNCGHSIKNFFSNDTKKTQKVDQMNVDIFE